VNNLKYVFGLDSGDGEDDDGCGRDLEQAVIRGEERGRCMALGCVIDYSVWRLD
jgi:hypothetical protein